MKCPKCDTLLSIAERQGIEIDFCPQCRGIWLDRGELDKIIERSAAQFDNKRHDDDDDRHRHSYDRDKDDYRGHNDDHHRHGKYGESHKYHKKKSFLDDLFDF